MNHSPARLLRYELSNLLFSPSSITFVFSVVRVDYLKVSMFYCRMKYDYGCVGRSFTYDEQCQTSQSGRDDVYDGQENGMAAERQGVLYALSHVS